MDKLSTLNFDLLEQWVDTEMNSVDTEIVNAKRRQPSNESVEFLKQFAAGYFPVESKGLEFECLLN